MTVSFADDDLASVMIAPEREHTGYGQGVIVSFDVETFENVIEYRGTRLHNLPVLTGPDALTYQPGDIVLLMRWTPSGRGVSSYWIAGRPVIPAAGRAEQVVEFMRGALAKQISAEVFAERIHSASDLDVVSNPGGSFTVAGPTIADVEITAARQAIILITARTQLTTSDTTNNARGMMSVQVSGASSIPPSDTRSMIYRVVRNVPSDDPHLYTDDGRFTVLDLFTPDQLNAGLHTFSAAYIGDGDGDVQFFNRNLTVIAF